MHAKAAFRSLLASALAASLAHAGAQADDPPVGKGFVAWIDDIALAKNRIGNRGIPVPKKKS